MEKKRKTIKIGNDEVSEDLFTKIHGYAVAEFKKQLVEDVVKKEFQCSACKVHPQKLQFTFFATQVPSQGIFTNKKVGNRTTQYTTFKTDMIKVILVLSISNSFTNKNTQGRKFSAV